MKKWIFILILSCTCCCLFGQRSKWLLNETTHDEYPVHFGFALGLNTMDCAVTGNAELEVLDYGFSIQAVGNFRLHPYFDLRTLPGISFGERDMTVCGQAMNMRISYVDVPVLLKYKSQRYSNIRPYLVIGGSLRYLLNKIAVDLEDLPAEDISDEKKYDLVLNRFEPYFDAGAGIDFYLPFFKFSLELRGSWGLQDCVRHASVRSGIESMKPSVYSLVFSFE